MAWLEAMSGHQGSVRVPRNFCTKSAPSIQRTLHIRHHAKHAARSLSISGADAKSAVSSASYDTDTSTVHFDWKRQWYPVAIVDDLPTDRPTATAILGKDLVVWHDKAQDWHVFEDKCPHRKVPLSEGRLETDGTLQCSYHGWRFNGRGACTTIPQARSQELDKQVAGAARACATVYPTLIADGLLFVWMDAGPNAGEESSRKQPQMTTDCVREQGSSAPWLMREVPQSWDVVLENASDPAHVPFSHHGVADRADRENPFKPNYTKIDRSGRDEGYIVSNTPEATHFSSNPRLQRIECFPPNHLRVATYDPRSKDGPGKRLGFMNLHAVPVTRFKSRLFFRFEIEMPSKSKPGIRIWKRPIWHSHLVENAILDGDAVFLTRQSQHLRAETMTRKDYYFATPADLPASALRQWLAKWAPNGPDYYDDVTDPFEGQNFAPPREAVLDRYNQHVKHCKSCSGALRNIRVGLRVLQVAFGATFLALAALLGQGHPLLSTSPLVAVGVMIVGAIAWHQLKAFERQFTFVDYVHADR